ncbi:MAG: UDP-N-acetylmuramate dehydrogenase [Candidatus Yanofskybacteria bacterium]|nr:UDP-N-acetylmuramate dehydrogenase [Candidatus Yanofskybacteria bacterium]
MRPGGRNSPLTIGVFTLLVSFVYMPSTQTVESLLPGVQRDVPLRDYATFRIGGSASYFFVATTKDQIRQAFLVSRQMSLPLLVLSGGSNMLISDNGFSGLVVLMKTADYTLQSAALSAEAGVSMDTLVQKTTEKGFAGLEWAGGLPGSVGGAVRGNAGAFGAEIKDSIAAVEFLDEKGNVRVLQKEQCEFSYRSSIFKTNGWIVLSAQFSLREGDKEQLCEEAASHIQYRKDHHPLEYPNAGSVFKNVDLKKLPKEFHERVRDHVKTDPFPVVPAAYLISEAGLKSRRIGEAQISEKHPNYIINLGGASVRDVLELIAVVKKEIWEKYHVVLEEEITILE